MAEEIRALHIEAEQLRALANHTRVSLRELLADLSR
jgi:hypothetical protein